MTESNDTPSKDLQQPETEAASQGPPPPPAERRQPWLPVLSALGFLILAGGIVYVWQQQADAPDLSAINRQVAELQDRVARLEQQPAASGNASQLASRLAALEQKVAADQQLASRLTALEQRLGNAGQLSDRVDALAQKLAAESQNTGRYDVLSGRIEALSGREQTAQDQLGQQLAAVDKRVSTLEHNAGDVAALDGRIARMARIQAASAALDAGQPIGNLPNAPSSLARFATAKPPTEAGLRLAFPAVARQAEAASRPDTTGKPFLQRAWARAQTLVTVKEGDDVLVGDPAAGILAQAQTALDAGDLARAVEVLSRLKGNAAQAVADWLDQAKALLAARAALAQMTGNG